MQLLSFSQWVVLVLVVGWDQTEETMKKRREIERIRPRSCDRKQKYCIKGFSTEQYIFIVAKTVHLMLRITAKQRVSSCKKGLILVLVNISIILC